MSKEKAVYSPGELGRVRENLGKVDDVEAKRMMKVLGGEVGVEKSENNAETGRSTRSDSSGKGKRGGSSPAKAIRRVETVADEDSGIKIKTEPKKKSLNPADDPNVPLKGNYFERIKMDQQAALSEFDIKSPIQLLLSTLSLFKKPVDLINSAFITKNMESYYKQLEILVSSTRTLLPRSDFKHTKQLEQMSPFMFSILDIIRNWNIERISKDIGRMKPHLKNVKANEFSDILRVIYKPLFILERLDTDFHIKGAYQLLYKILFIDNPIEAKEKYQILIQSAMTAFGIIRKDIHYLLYPLLMRLLSDTWLPYDRFFSERRQRFMAFLNATEEDRIDPESMNQKEKNDDDDEPKAEAVVEENAAETREIKETTEITENEVQDVQKDTVEAKREAVNDPERKSLERGLHALESLFPKAGWNQIDTYPDLYPYFAGVLNLKRGYELIAPTDPILQVAILMHILEELFFGLRYASFGSIIESDGSSEPIGQYLEEIINNWNDYQIMFQEEYLNRLQEYCQLLESSAGSRNSDFAKRLLVELNWVKRYYFLPYFRFERLASRSSFKKSNVSPMYHEIRKIRKHLTVVATGIERGSKQGGAESNAPCDGINNPWAPYNFQVANPLSMRLNALLGSKKRNNASLVFFTLSVVTVLDYLVNNENSWAYENYQGDFFRSVNNEGVIPQFGVDEKINADAIFKQVMKERREKKEG